jgi:dipeptidyl-peptidase 4
MSPLEPLDLSLDNVAPTTGAAHLDARRIANRVSRHLGDHATGARSGGLCWQADGERLLLWSRNDNDLRMDVHRTDNGEHVTRLDSAALVDELGRPLDVHDAQLDLHRDRVVLFTDAQRTWRTASRGNYWLLDLTSGHRRRIGRGLPERELSFAKLSPDGRGIAYVCRNDLYYEPLNSGQPARLTFDGGPARFNGCFDWAYEEGFGCRDGSRWSPDGTWLAFWHVNCDTVERISIPPTIGGGSAWREIPYSRPGRRIGATRIGLLDVNRATVRWLPAAAGIDVGYVPRMQWLHDDCLLLLHVDRYQHHARLLRWTLSTDSVTSAYEEHDPAWIDVIPYDLASDKWAMSDIPLTPDRAACYWLSDRQGWRQLYEVSLTGAVVRCLTPPGFDATRLVGCDAATGDVYFGASPEVPSERYLYRVHADSAGAVERLTPADCTGVNVYVADPTGRFAVHRHSNRCTPWHSAVIRLTDHQPLGLPSPTVPAGPADPAMRPRVLRRQVARPVPPHWDVQILLPPDYRSEERYPAVFVVYGYPMSQLVSEAYPSAWARTLADMGYLVISSDPIGTPCPKGRQWRKGFYPQLGRANCRDQADICRAVTQWPQIDPARMAVFGWCEGGAMVLQLMSEQPQLFRVGIAVAPICDPHLHYAIYQERYRGESRDAYGGAPIHNPAAPAGDVLIVHGTADDQVHVEHSDRYVRAMAARGRQLDFLVVPGCSHSLSEGPRTTQRLHAWLAEYLDRRIGGGPERVRGEPAPMT